MGLESVKKEIITEAERKAKEIIEQAKKEATRIKAEVSKESRDYQKEAEANNQALIEAMQRRMLAAANFDAQRMLMNRKKEIIDEVLRGVKNKLLSLNKGQREEFLINLLRKAETEIDIETIFVNEKDKELIEEGVKVKAAELEGGLIAQNKEGTISLNLSVEELLENARHETLIEISEVLFGKQ